MDVEVMMMESKAKKEKSKQVFFLPCNEIIYTIPVATHHLLQWKSFSDWNNVLRKTIPKIFRLRTMFQKLKYHEWVVIFEHFIHRN